MILTSCIKKVSCEPVDLAGEYKCEIHSITNSLGIYKSDTTFIDTIKVTPLENTVQIIHRSRPKQPIELKVRKTTASDNPCNPVLEGELSNAQLRISFDEYYYFSEDPGRYYSKTTIKGTRLK